MHNYIKAVFIHLFSLIPLLTKAQTKKITDKKYVKIEVIVEDTTMFKDAEIQFFMNKDGVNSEYLKSSNRYTFKINGAHTNITIPLSTAINYGRINYIYGRRKNSPFDVTNNLFVFENGDSVSLIINKKEAFFRGKDSAKYNYVKMVNEKVVGAIKATPEIDSLFRTGNYELMLKKQKLQIDSMFASLSDTLKVQKDDISQIAYRYIEVDNWAKYNKKILSLLIARSFRANPRYHSIFATFFSEFFKSFNANRFEQEFLAASYHYADFLFLKAEWETILSLNPTLNSKNGYSFKQLYNYIQAKNNGLVRDKVTLIAFNLNYKVRLDVGELIDDALYAMSNSKYKMALQGMEKFLSGDAFAFALPDAKGKIHKLSDYKGKLIVLDFWFTGCMPCRFLAEAMKPIVASYKSNPNVVFITVNVEGERYRDIWLRSLKEETYSSKDEVNLLAIEGVNSEIIKFYNIQAYPTIFIISKTGKMITTAPPRPSISKPENSKAFKELINRCL